MQTFLPYEDFKQSAKVLDNKRLGKQRVECLQIINVLKGKSKGWRNHPAILQWKGYTYTLALYGSTMSLEWVSRGFKDNLLMFFQTEMQTSNEKDNPPWLGNERYHASHRSNLLRKNFDYYKQFNWLESANLPYFWPVKKSLELKVYKINNYEQN
jgi:hypothetical protein